MQPTLIGFTTPIYAIIYWTDTKGKQAGKTVCYDEAEVRQHEQNASNPIHYRYGHSLNIHYSEIEGAIA